MTSSLDEKKDLASQWFRSLRDQFCAAFEELDGGKFERKKWNHKGSGGGEISILKGEVFEKVGVNISTVAGEFSDDFKSQIKGTEKSAEYWASGISLVAHMQSPKVPAFHFNTRFLATGENWFGGGTDMTPSIPDDKETKLFHAKLKEACDKSDNNYYSDFKKNCDEYFYLVKELGSTTLNIIKETVSSKKDLDWTEEEKEQQLIKRGRYVEFNLIWDRGTLFGLKTGGSTEAILMSMPPSAKWK